LKEKGIDIDFDNKIGEGNYGSVYWGRYRTTSMVDFEGNPFRHVMEGKEFAVKYIEFDEDIDVSYDAREVKKYILTQVNHSNLVYIQMNINMGDFRILEFKDRLGHFFQSFDRIYLFMNFADLGNIGT
jgi:hypothetical protein